MEKFLIEQVIRKAGAGSIVLRGDRSAWLPEHQTLLAADLHLGKAEAMQKGGLPVPAGSDAPDLARLQNALEATAARRLVILGDLFHHPPSLTPERRSGLLAALRRACGAACPEIIPGNHDRLPCAVLEEAGLAVLRQGRPHRLPFSLHHRPPAAGPAPPLPFLAGHIHPVTRIAAAGERLRLPCFLIYETGIVLPAFGSFTGGRLFGDEPGITRLAVFEGALIEL